MLDLFDKRVALITGKGGVGKTTVSAALAEAAAKRGVRVLLTEIGEPDGDYTPLARMYGRDTLPAAPERLAAGIDGCVLWARAGHEGFFKSVIPVAPLVRAAMRSGALRKLLDTAPSFREMGVFYHLFSLLEEKLPNGDNRYDLVLVDMPASGHALGLTGLRDRLLALMPTGPISEALRAGEHYFLDPEIVGAYVVTLPETLPVTECLELMEGLETTRTPVGGVLVNRVLEDPFTEAERTALLPHVEDKVFGMARFQSLEQCGESMATLQGATDAAITAIPEMPLQGPELIDAIADHLLSEAGS